jgi:hypothetical protein
VLYEEDPAPDGLQFAGSAVWRTEARWRVAPGPGQKPEFGVRADIEIPERKMSVHLWLQRNDDPRLLASHMVEVEFALPSDSQHGAIVNVPGLLMKASETTRGVPLNGASVKIVDGFFIVGLSNVEADRQRNVQLMKEQSWLDVPIVYGDGHRAILAVEKPAPGARALAVLGLSGAEQLTAEQPRQMPVAVPPSPPKPASEAPRSVTTIGVKPWPDKYAVLPLSTQLDDLSRLKPRHSVVIAGDNGGEIGAYVTKYRTLAADGATFRIDGRCVSACTIVLTYADRVCITKRAVLGFHQARDKSGKRLQAGSDYMMSIYPAPVREYISAHGGLPPPTDMMLVTGPALRGLVRACE